MNHQISSLVFDIGPARHGAGAIRRAETDRTGERKAPAQRKTAEDATKAVVIGENI